MPLRNDIWRSAILAAPIAEVASGRARPPPLWLPQTAPFTFDADPFGIWRDGRMYVFVEHYDYRVRVGAIDVLCYDAALRLSWRRPALREAWHLSYPAVFGEAGETWMLPEAHRSGALTLYRAREFPTAWEPAARITLDCVPVDATPVKHGGRWWLFYSPAGSARDKTGKLHVAFADHIGGPWTAHPGNPVRVDRSSSRCGGTPFMLDGELVLPMQDCRHTYGGAIRLLHVRELTPTTFEARTGALLSPGADFAPWIDGLHTLSACGAVTLVDAKHVATSWRGVGIDLRWRLRRLRRAITAPGGA